LYACAQTQNAVSTTVAMAHLNLLLDGLSVAGLKI